MPNHRSSPSFLLPFAVLSALLLALPGSGIFGDSAIHTVQKGQTIYSIARRYGIPPALIIAENDIADPRNVAVGTVLSIPGTYEVQRGDSYYGIARRFSVDLDELLATNNRSSDTILREGETLILPASARIAEDHRTVTEDPPDISESRDIVLDSNAEVLGSWPLSGARSPMSGKLPGVMIRGAVGDEVRSIASGRVRYTGTYSAFGRVVMVQSPEGYLYVYGGTDRVTVSVGDLVAPGALLGLLGNGPHSNEPALYFSVFKGNVPVRPEDAPRG